jgi:hypothetical protein
VAGTKIHGRRKPGVGISESTAHAWLHRLGFVVANHKKGVYFDGHERPDVVLSRILYLVEKKEYDKRLLHTMPTEAQKAAFRLLPKDERPIVELSHDECCFNSNEDVSRTWAEEKNQSSCKSKSKGAGMMVSAFISEIDGPQLEYTMAAGGELLQLYTLLEYGTEGYWTSDKMMEQMAIVGPACMEKFDYAICLFKFDHSSNHTAFADDALNAMEMNSSDGGSQPVMRDTKWRKDGEGEYTFQSMVTSSGKQKGLKTVLQERGINVDGFAKQALVDLMAAEEDFKGQLNRIQDYFINTLGAQCVFYPKFHCEISPIEPYWGAAKIFARQHCRYNIAGLRIVVPMALRAVCLSSIARFFAKCRRTEQLYREGAASIDMNKLLNFGSHRYKSHRRVFGLDYRAEELQRLCWCNACLPSRKKEAREYENMRLAWSPLWVSDPAFDNARAAQAQEMRGIAGAYSAPCNQLYCRHHGSQYDGAAIEKMVEEVGQEGAKKYNTHTHKHTHTHTHTSARAHTQALARAHTTYKDFHSHIYMHVDTYT